MLSVLSQSVDVAQFERQLVTVALLVVLDDGGSLHVSLNAAVAALVDASVPMKCVPLTVHVRPRPGLDALMTYNTPDADEFLAFESHGPLSPDELETCFSSANDQRAALLAFLQAQTPAA